METKGMGAWPEPSYDIVAAGKELGLSPKREATPWFSNKAGPKDDWREKSGALSLPKRGVLEMPRRERLQEQLEREARESRLRAESLPDGSVLHFDRDTEELVADSSGHLADKLIESAAAQLDDGWIQWRGLDCPVKGTPVLIRIGNGQEFNLKKPETWSWFNEGTDYYWQIIAYRVIQPKQEGKA